MNEKKFYKMVFMLVTPIAIQNIINVGIQSIDVIMLGKSSETALSASSLAGQVYFIMSLVIFGVASGATVLSAQYWGCNDRSAIEKILGIGFRTAAGIGIFFTAASLLFSRQIMMIFTSEPDIINEGISYLRIVSYSFVISAITMVYLSIMRSMEFVIISTIVYLISMIVNIVVNGLLIFGYCGFPEMGIKGAAIGTLIARIIEFVIVIIYSKRNKTVLVKNSLKKINNRPLINDFIGFSVPVIINELLWGTGISVTTAILGQMGSAVSSANAVVQVTRQLAMVVSMGIASATAITVGKVIGEGKIELAREYGKRFMHISILSGIAGSIIVLIVRPIILYFMVLSDGARKNLSYMMIILSIYVFFQAITCTGIVGVFRAGGDTKYGTVVDVSTLWMGSIVFGLLAVYVFNLNFKMIYIILLCDEPLKIPMVYMRYKSYRWLNNVTRKKESERIVK